MMDFSDVDRFAARLRRIAEVERQADPILEKHGAQAGRLVNRYAPKRTRPRNQPASFTQDSPGSVTFPPYLVGEYKGSSSRGPNRRFLRAALKDVEGPFLEDVADLVRRSFRG